MAYYPKATLALLPENRTQPTIRPNKIIYHTAVDSPGSTNLPGYFGRADVTVESHFWITRTGQVVQMMDTVRRADANYKANDSAVSIETEDEGDPIGIPWNEAQLTALVELTEWLLITHDIPRELCRSWESAGIGWHSMFGFKDPINQTGVLDNPWSTSRGKTCPGKTRIGQIIDVILPRLTKQLPIPTEENAMNIEAIILYVNICYGTDSPDRKGKLYWIDQAVDKLVAGDSAGALATLRYMRDALGLKA